MRILFVTNTKLGIPEMPTVDFFPIAISTLGHEVTVFGKEGGQTEHFARHHIETVESVYRSPRWFADLRRVAREIQPDIVHVFIHLGCGAYPVMMQATPRSKFVLDIRSPLLRHGLRRRMIQLKNQLEIVGYDAIAAHGEEAAWTVVGRKPDIAWFPPGIELNAIATRTPVSETPADLKSQEPLRCIYIGALRKSRRIDQMLRAIAQVESARAFCVDLFGYGSPEEIADLEAMIEQLGLSGHVHLRGLLPRAELFATLSTYDIGLSYVPTALYDSAPPLKTIEYLAAGLAVLATDTVGHRLIVEEGENGLLAPEDPPAFAAGLTRLLSDPQLRAQLTRVARKSVEPFDWDRIAVDRILPLYHSLLDDGRSDQDS